MQQTKKESPLLRIWGWGKDEHSRLIGAVISALIGVLLGLMPYYAAAQVIIGMLAGETTCPYTCRGLAWGLRDTLHARFFTTWHYLYPIRRLFLS